jgi:hypothetical protein
MGVDEGFDIYPALNPSWQDIYDDFLEEILQKYKDAVHPITGETLIRIIGDPHAKYAYIYFQFGEGAIIPYRCEYFLRFSSKLVSRDPKVDDYLREVYFVAKRYFPCNLEYWIEGGRSFTYHASEVAPHDPRDVYEVRDKLLFPVEEGVRNKRENSPNLFIPSSSPPPARPSRVSGFIRSRNVRDTAIPTNVKFFHFPTEIRVKIYEELLVHSEPITFTTCDDHSWPIAFLSKRYGLCPALLRANTTVHREARPLLYSSNCFRFCDLERHTLCGKSAVLTSFISQIGLQNASFLRHVCIDFPAFDDYRPGTAMLQEDSIKTLDLIRDSCKGIVILETWLRDPCPLEWVDYKFDSSPIAADALDLLDARFKTISSLEEVIVDVPVYSDDDQTRDDALSNDLSKKMRDCGWTIKVSLSELKESWFSWEEDEGVDYDYYLEMLRVEEREANEWAEIYERRRRDPYWKNDSDFD